METNDSSTPSDNPLCGNRLSGLFEAAMENNPLNWEPPTPEHLSELLPQYRIIGLLGRGGMGAVYRAEQISLGREVAIKLLPAELAGSEEFLRRFRQEAQTLARLQHPGIVAVYDFGQTMEGHLYFIMEYVDGTDLHQLISTQGLTAPQVLELITQVCEALHYAHSKGVVHRDIKPANVLIGQDGKAKLADFGLARPLDGIPHSNLTATNQAMGTPDYMAPEQWVGKGDERTDIYALGVMLYEMLTGTRPKGVFDPPSVKVAVDVRIDEVVIKALRQEPERRFQQVREMKDAVEHIRHTPPPGTMASTAKPQAGPVPRQHAQAAAPKPVVRKGPQAPGAVRQKKTLAQELTVLLWTLVVLLMVGYGAVWYFDLPVTEWLGKEPAVTEGGVSDTAGKGKPGGSEGFTNSLGMKFVPLPGENVLMCIHETRVKDYEAYAAETANVEQVYKRMKNSHGLTVSSEANDPVTGLVWSEMDGFCSWLSRKEGRVYRLPTDREWSVAIGVGDKEDASKLPRELNGQVQGYLWGSEPWPPPAGIGNLADSSLEGKGGGVIPGYTDGFPTVSPVMSFKPNALGLYDLIGNVWEWTGTYFDEKADQKVLRGTSWTDTGGFKISHRTKGGENGRVCCYGFRLVLEQEKPEAVAKSEAGFVPLLDAAHYPDWQMVGAGDANLNSGELTLSRPQGTRGAATFWYTKARYADFVLRVDFKLTTPEANSGLILRFADPKGEASVPDRNRDHYHVDISNSKNPKEATGAIMFLQAASEQPAKTGEWNTMEVTATGQRYLVRVNGKLVNDFAGKRSLAGFIGFQNYRMNGVTFRNLRIQGAALPAEVKTTAAVAVPNATLRSSESRAVQYPVRNGGAVEARDDSANQEPILLANNVMVRVRGLLLTEAQAKSILEWDTFKKEPGAALPGLEKWVAEGKVQVLGNTVIRMQRGDQQNSLATLVTELSVDPQFQGRTLVKYVVGYKKPGAKGMAYDHHKLQGEHAFQQGETAYAGSWRLKADEAGTSQDMVCLVFISFY